MTLTYRHAKCETIVDQTQLHTRTAGKDAFDGNMSYELIPFSDLKPRLNRYLLAVGVE